MSENYIQPEKQDIDAVEVPSDASFFEEMNLLVHLAREYPDEDELQLELNAPATEEEIAEFEKRNNISLTDDLKALYKFANGFSLECANLDISTLAQIESDLSNEYEWGDSKNYVLIGEMIGDGEIILLDLDTNKIITNDHGDETVFDDISMLLSDIIFTFLENEVDDEELENYINGFEVTESYSE